MIRGCSSQVSSLCAPSSAETHARTRKHLTLSQAPARLPALPRYKRRPLQLVRTGVSIAKPVAREGPRAALAARVSRREKPLLKVTARILAQSQLGASGRNASPLRSYHAQQPNNMAKSLVGEDSAPPQATVPLAYVTADRGARSPAPPPLSSFYSSSPPPSYSPSLPSTRKALGSQIKVLIHRLNILSLTATLGEQYGGGVAQMKFSEPKQNELNFEETSKQPW